jgi:hypothetical protein
MNISPKWEPYMAGYSGTPLVKKLGIREGSKLYLANAPNNYLKLVSPLPDGVKIVSRVSSNTDMVHIFSTKEVHLTRTLRAVLPKIKQDGMIWVSWPKKSAKVPTDITEDTIRKVALPLGLVDIKVCAVDDVWSGLKLVIRKELRKAEAQAASSTSRAKTARR